MQEQPKQPRQANTKSILGQDCPSESIFPKWLCLECCGTGLPMHSGEIKVSLWPLGLPVPAPLPSKGRLPTGHGCLGASPVENLKEAGQTLMKGLVMNLSEVRNKALLLLSLVVSATPIPESGAGSFGCGCQGQASSAQDDTKGTGPPKADPSPKRSKARRLAPPS